jgi:uncharacterized protein DUF4154
LFAFNAFITKRINIHAKIFACISRVFYLVLTCILFSNSVNAIDFRESDIKAAYIYNFLHFIEWPTNNNSPLNICIYGSNESAVASFDSMPTSTKTGKLLNVIFIKTSEKSPAFDICQTIFINKTSTKNTQSILDIARSNHILTIGESKNFIKQGGMINFFIANEKIGFNINEVELKKSDLKISSQILRLANKVFRDETHE